MSHSHASHAAAHPHAHGGNGHDPHHHGHGHHAHEHHVHVMPLSVLFTIFGLLLAFTVITVVISKFHLGALEVPITMAIATFKATLVAVYFMHLRYDNPFNAMIFTFSLFFVGLFLGGALIDVTHYQKDLIPPTPIEAAPAAPAAAPADAPAPAAPAPATAPK